LRRWIKTKGINTLEDISIWRGGEWEYWRIHNLPQCLVPQWRNLISHLKGETPLSKDTKDSLRWDPDGGDYSVKSGYATLHHLENRGHGK